jgi:RNA polymerase sigma-70 factor (ECF subfamily)
MSTSISAEADIESWFRAYAPRLKRAAYRIVGNADDADDALQDAFLAAFRAHDRYNGGDPYPWLYRIATRKALNIATARHAVVELGDAPAVRAPSAEEEALRHMRSGALSDFMRREPAVELHLLDGLRFREVGARLGTPAATAATRIRRGKMRLRSYLQATLAEMPESKPA